MSEEENKVEEKRFANRIRELAVGKHSQKTLLGSSYFTKKQFLPNIKVMFWYTMKRKISKTVQRARSCLFLCVIVLRNHNELLNDKQKIWVTPKRIRRNKRKCMSKTVAKLKVGNVEKFKRQLLFKEHHRIRKRIE